MIALSIALGVVAALSIRGFLRLDNPRARWKARQRRRRFRRSLINRRYS